MSRSSHWHKLSNAQKTVIERHQVDGPVPVGAIARELGIEVKVSNLGPGKSGQIKREGDSYVIKLNRFESRERQRFTLAHELAHFLLHQDIIDHSPDGISDTVLYRSGNPERIEYEANSLAADILMPRTWIESALGEFKGRITEPAIEALAERFRVSKAAMEVRLSTIS